MLLANRRTRKRKSAQKKTNITWSADTELVGLVLELMPQTANFLYPQYTIGLHAWFLDKVRQTNPDLSRYLHNGQSEKPFTISGLEGELLSLGKSFQLQLDQTYRWTITAMSSTLVEWLAQWVQELPATIELRNTPLQIRDCQIAFPPTTYRQLWETSPHLEKVKLSWISPTSFRRKGHHFPLPVPTNVFHSYLRRWNDFSGIPIDQEEFLEWVDRSVLIVRHQLESMKVVAGKKGSVTGFTGAIEFCLSESAGDCPEFERLFYALLQLAPYCGTGHKTTFGLGQTRVGWLLSKPMSVTTIDSALAPRIAELTEIFVAQRKRQGGSRAREIAETWATILARRELGESLQDIATDLEMPYETVKTYSKLARRSLNNHS